jgi:alpha-N-arabinofuranosidase
VDHVKTLGSALFVASTMKVFLEHPDVEIANAFKLNDVGFMGWIGARYEDHLTRAPADNQYLPTAPYLAFQLFSRYFGSRVVATTTVSPTYDSEAVGMTSAVSKVPYLDVVSSLSEDGRTLYAIAVNKHFDLPIDTRMTFRAFRPSGSAVVRTLQGTGIDANTGTRLPKGGQWVKQVEDPKNPRFSRGAPDEVTVATSSLDVRSELSYRFPPHSVTAFQIPGSKP